MQYGSLSPAEALLGSCRLACDTRDKGAFAVTLRSLFAGDCC